VGVQDSQTLTIIRKRYSHTKGTIMALFYWNSEENTLHSTSPTPSCNLLLCKDAGNLRLVSITTQWEMFMCNICDHCLPTEAYVQNTFRERLRQIRRYSSKYLQG